MIAFVVVSRRFVLNFVTEFGMALSPIPRIAKKEAIINAKLSKCSIETV